MIEAKKLYNISTHTFNPAMLDAFKMWRYDEKYFSRYRPFQLDSINEIAGMESKFDFQGISGDSILNEVQDILKSNNITNYLISFDGEFLSKNHKNTT
jgi:hypothetical protein